MEGVRRAYLNDDDAQSPETRISKTGQSPSSKGPPESPCTPEDEERLKKEEEHKKIAETETEESSTVAKRKGYRIFLYGHGFAKSSEIRARFTWDGKVT